MTKIINRYILKEIGFPFLATLFIFTFVLLIGKILQIIEMVVNKGVGIIDIAQLILFIMPSFLMFTLPISFLIAVLIGLGRLSGDNEITVLRASGMSLLQLFAPIVAAGVMVSLLTAAICFVAPLSNLASKGLLFHILQQKASVGIKERVFNDDFHGLVLYADHISGDGDYMDGLLISDQRLTKEATTIIARRGILVSNPQAMTLTLRLMDGSIHVVDPGHSKYKKTDFSTYDVRLDINAGTNKSAETTTARSTDMTFDELLENIKRRDLNPSDVRDMIIELHRKLTIPLSCIVFALLGLPFGIVNQRSGKSRGFTVGLAIVVVYYTLQLAGDALGETGRISPVVAVWAPNAILGTVGLYCFMMASREKPIAIVNLTVWLENLFARLKRTSR